MGRKERRAKRKKEKLGTTKKVEKIVRLKQILGDEDIEFDKMSMEDIEKLLQLILKPIWIRNLPEENKKELLVEFGKSFAEKAFSNWEGPILKMIRATMEGKGGLASKLLS